MVKRYSNLIQNTVSFEHSVLSEVTCHHLAELCVPHKFNLEPRLMPPLIKSSRNLATLLEDELSLPKAGMTYESASAARVSQFEVVHQRDVVLFHGALSEDNDPLLTGEVWQIVSIQGHGLYYLAVIISVWPKFSQNEDGSVMVVTMQEDDTRIAVLTDVQCALVYRRKADGQAQVLVPRLYRGCI